MSPPAKIVYTGKDRKTPNLCVSCQPASRDLLHRWRRLFVYYHAADLSLTFDCHDEWISPLHSMQKAKEIEPQYHFPSFHTKLRNVKTEHLPMENKKQIK